MSAANDANRIKPFVMGWIRDRLDAVSGGQGLGGSPSPHDLSSGHHSGTLSDAQGPQFALLSGARPFTGSIVMASGATVDGVDIDLFKLAYDAHAVDPNAHHRAFIGLRDSTGGIVYPDGSNLITLALGSGVSATASGDVIRLNLRLASPSGLTVAGDVLALDDSVAGSGLVISGKQLGVGAGDGLTVGTNTVDLLTPGTLSVISANVPAGNHTHAINASDDPGVSSALLKTNAIGWLTLVRMNIRPMLGTSGIDILSVNPFTAPLINITTPLSSSVDNGIVLAARTTTTETDRLRVHSNGALGMGSGAATPDVYLSRYASNTFLIAADYAATTGPGHLTVAGRGLFGGIVLPATASLASVSADGTPQLLLGYDSDSYGTFTVDNGGNVELDTGGQIVLDPVGEVVRPARPYETDLGSLTHKWRSIFAAELWVETLVAQQTKATIGGRILVGPTTELEDDLLAASTRMITAHNDIDISDTLYMEANGRVEFVQVTGVYENYARNGSMEDWDQAGVTLSRWTVSGGASVTRITEEPFHGRYSIRITG
jgi:hypothetical protein